MAIRPDLTDMHVKKFSDFRPPSRRPWLGVLLIVLVAVAGVQGVRRLRARSEKDSGADVAAPPEAPPGDTAAENTESAPAAKAGPAPRRRASREAEAAASASRKPDTPTVRLDAAAAEQRLAAGRRLREENKLPEAREHFLALLEAGPPAAIRNETERILGEINVELITSPWMIPEKKTYTVKSGDSLQKIAKAFGVTVELIGVSNRIANPDRIRAGDHYRILDRPRFEIRVRKNRNDLLLTLNGRFFKRYPVGTGEYGKTPEGVFVIRDKIPEPPWWPPGGAELPYGHPDNILGTRWMSLEATGETPPVKGYGIHGTWDNTTIGKQSSAGCIRMRNSDVEELFMLVPWGTRVTITE